MSQKNSNDIYLLRREIFRSIEYDISKGGLFYLREENNRRRIGLSRCLEKNDKEKNNCLAQMSLFGSVNVSPDQMIGFLLVDRRLTV